MSLAPLEKRAALRAIGVYTVLTLIGFAVGGSVLSVLIPFAVAFVLTRYSKAVEKEKAALRSAVWMGLIAVLGSLLFLAMSPVEVGQWSEDGNDFTVSLVATILVNFSVGAALGGLGGFVAEATRPARSSSPPPPPSSPPLPPSSPPDDGDQPGIDLRDKWRSR